MGGFIQRFARFIAACSIGLMGGPLVSWAGKPFELIVVALGDSTTAGTPEFRSPAEVPPSGAGDARSQYAYWVMTRHPEWQVVNRGIAGERSDEILQRFASDVVAHRPQAVVILAGVNDLYQGYPVRWVTEHLERMYQAAAEARIPVLACTVMPYNGMSDAVRGRMAEVNAWIRAYSAEHHLTLCDLFTVMEDPSAPGRLINTVDGLHPDVEGYRRMGEAVTEVLERLVASWR